MRLVVIGGVAAGLSAAARARRLDRSLEILVLEKSSHISYGACGLPYYIEGQVRTLDQLQVYTVDYFARERDIRVRTNTEVASISHGRREVALGSGERVHYDKLILATGARRDLSLLRGADQPHVFTLDTWDTAERLKAFMDARKPKRAAIVGAGYIGLEAAEALRAQGMEVAVYQRSDNVLRREDPWLTAVVAKHLDRCRVKLQLNTPQQTIPEADLVVVATGLKPNVTLAAEAGIELGRSGPIRSNERMETNLTGVYAAGDCAETMHLVTNRPVWIPLGTTANKMGRVAGACAAGGRERFPGIAGTSIVRVCGLGVGMTGLSDAQAKRDGFDPVSVQIESQERPRYFGGRPNSVQLTADRRTGRLIGGVIVGEEGVGGRINVIATALTQRMLVEDFQYLDLSYAPPYSTVWDPLLIAAQQLIGLLH
ncbi:MAG TPA: FAD-dependent oxidoreductase [Bryobacteraceae bacterium]|nr:FAD-dependent oxidoreductase [Bryobacteraceae bacterium]